MRNYTSRFFPRPHRLSLILLWTAFAACLALRGWYVFYNGPLGHLFSDPGRHWENGQFFFSPKIMGSIDPLAYQFWLWALQWVDHEREYVVLAGTAVLSMALPFFWLKALRELLPWRWALAGAIVIGFMPSLFLIYSYFMSETLLLSLAACGFWLALRALRTRDMPTLAALVLVWSVAAYTRLAALPLAALCLLAVATALTWPKRAALVAATGLCFGALAYPACWHSGRQLNFCAPFGMGYINAAYRGSAARTIEFHVPNKGGWWFSSPSLATPPFAPFSDWNSSREGTRRMTIDTANGRKDWETTLRAMQEHDPGLPWITDKSENAIVLFFGPSWPDGNLAYTWGWLSYWNRWLWLPLTVAVALLMLKVRPALRDGLIPLSGIVLIALLLVQTSGVMEGRYRKPAEPLLIAGAVVLLHRLRSARPREQALGAVAHAESRNGSAATPSATERAIIPAKI